MKGDPIIREWKQFKERGQLYRIRAFAGLHYIRGNSAPYFTITGETQRAERGYWREDSGGCLHTEILKHWPELDDLVAMHLSDISGAPMHDGANGWYWMAGAMGGAGEQYHGGNSEMQHWKPDGSFDGFRCATPNESLIIFAKHARIPVADAMKLRDDLLVELGPAQEDAGAPAHRPADFKRAKAKLVQWMEAQRPRWKREAEACIAKHGLKLYGDTWPRTDADEAAERR